MQVLLERSSGYVELDVVVRAYDKMTNTIDYAVLCPDGKIVWQNGSEMGVGALREAKSIYEDLKEIQQESLNQILGERLPEINKNPYWLDSSK